MNISSGAKRKTSAPAGAENASSAWGLATMRVAVKRLSAGTDSLLVIEWQFNALGNAIFDHHFGGEFPIEVV